MEALSAVLLRFAFPALNEEGLPVVHNRGALVIASVLQHHKLHYDTTKILIIYIKKSLNKNNISILMEKY